MATDMPACIKVELDDDEEDIGDFEEEKGDDEVDLDLCFVCCSRVQVSQPLDNVNQQLSNNLRTVFLMRNLMQVPSSQLEENLKKCGNPENWISLCDTCTQLTNKALELHLKIEKIRKIILEKTRLSSKRSTWRRREVWTRTRSIVINHEKNPITGPTTTYTSTNCDATSILETENLAESLESSQTATPDIDDADDNWGDNQGDDDDDYQPSEGETNLEENNEQLTSKLENVETHRKKWNRYMSTRTYKRSIQVDGKWKCHHCDELFLRRTACYQHELRVHFKVPGQFCCDFCGKRLNSRKSLNDHRRQVHKILADGTPRPLPKLEEKDKVHICDTCGKTYKHPNCLRAHLRYTHLKKLNYPCHVCEHKFQNATDKNRHLFRMHKEDPVTQQLIADGFKDQIQKKSTKRKRGRVKKVKAENAIQE